MMTRPRTKRTASRGIWRAVLTVCVAAWLPGLVPAQEPSPQPRNLPDTVEKTPIVIPSEKAPEPIIDPAVVRVGCSTCTNGLLGGPVADDGHYIGPGPTGCGTGQCVPGLKKCNCADCSECETMFGRLMCGFYDCICCPDPCYEPCWHPLVDTAFFQDSARPVTQIRYRYDNGWGFERPDRAEWFMARPRTNPNQLGPGGAWAKQGIGKGPPCIAEKLDYGAFRMYMEAATQTFGFFVELAYLNVDPNTAPASIQPNTAAGAGGINLGGGLNIPGAAPVPGGAAANRRRPSPVPAPCCSASGFGDMNLGTKSVLIDCELLLLTFQFKTFLPTGNFTQGIGTGHVSLEPSLLFAIKLTQECYLQGQLAYWFPIGGDPLYQGNVFHSHLALNKNIWKPSPGTRLVGTLEFNNFCVLGGNYTETGYVIPNPNATANTLNVAPVAIPASAFMVTVGPGVRLFCCDRVDLGVGSAIAVTGEHFEKQLLRVDLRVRF